MNEAPGTVPGLSSEDNMTVMTTIAANNELEAIAPDMLTDEQVDKLCDHYQRKIDAFAEWADAVKTKLGSIKQRRTNAL